MKIEKNLLWGVVLGVGALFDCNALTECDCTIAAVTTPSMSQCACEEVSHELYQPTVNADRMDTAIITNLWNLKKLWMLEKDNLIESYSVTLPMDFSSFTIEPATPKIEFANFPPIACHILTCCSVAVVQPRWNSSVAKSGLFTRHKGDKAPLSGAVVEPATSRKISSSANKSISYADIKQSNEKWFEICRKKILLEMNEKLKQIIVELNEKHWNSTPAKSGLFNRHKGDKAPLSSAVSK
ncbi:MAG: hypothetical protein LBT70_00335 [Holosporaceae bacterium]|nr:hypothetical protein [Holosporaceae bacterium]